MTITDARGAVGAMTPVRSNTPAAALGAPLVVRALLGPRAVCG
ncbi:MULTISPECIES: hypothetical protein [Streptomyces]|nr:MULTISPECIES: hypothetical protein [Streptomyces]